MSNTLTPEAILADQIRTYRREKYKQLKVQLESRDINNADDFKTIKELRSNWSDLLIACFNLETELDAVTF